MPPSSLDVKVLPCEMNSILSISLLVVDIVIHAEHAPWTAQITWLLLYFLEPRPPSLQSPKGCTKQQRRGPTAFLPDGMSVGSTVGRLQGSR